MLSSLNGKQDFQCDCPDPSTIPTGYARHSVFSELKRKTSNKATTDLLVMHCALFTMFFVEFSLLCRSSGGWQCADLCPVKAVSGVALFKL